MKKKEQIESELRTIIKNSKKGIFVNLTLTNLIEISRRMYIVYENFKSGEKFKIKNKELKGFWHLTSLGRSVFTKQ